jgi:2-hydroxychromene-2-carboxylate isomerase
MNVNKRLKAKAISTWLGPTGQAARKILAQVKQGPASIWSERANPRSGARVDFYFDLQDAHSYLAAQAMQRLVTAYGVDYSVTIVSTPASDVNPQPAMRNTNAAREAIELAALYDLDFPGKKGPDGGLVKKAGAVLALHRPAVDQLAAALDTCSAMWKVDAKGIALAAGKWGTESQVMIEPALNTAYQRLRKAGHYVGASFCYRNQWYVGIDRLHYLEAVLAADTGRPVAGVIKKRAAGEPLLLSKQPLQVEMWYSFRSPYSYLALERISNVVGTTSLRLRPLAPMVDRGMKLATSKLMYTLLDAAREAKDQGIRFGNICDPLGKGVSHCLGIAKWCDELGPQQALAFAKSATRGIWSEARDMADYADLRFVVERAGLDWAQASKAALDTKAMIWATEASNDLAVFGLWGVPSFHVGDLSLWGQDRMDVLLSRLARHHAAAALAPDPVTEPSNESTSAPS